MPYMSPEQWGNGAAIDNTTDIWAVGIIMYIMLTGKHPLDPLTGHELMVTGFLNEPTPALKEKAPQLPTELGNIIDKCLVKDKAQRWNDALALLRALKPYQPGRFTAKSDRVRKSPYNGLAYLQEEDAGRFFGRNRESAAMSQRLRDRRMHGRRRPLRYRQVVVRARRSRARPEELRASAGTSWCCTRSHADDVAREPHRAGVVDLGQRRRANRRTARRGPTA